MRTNTMGECETRPVKALADHHRHHHRALRSGGTR